MPSRQKSLIVLVAATIGSASLVVGPRSQAAPLVPVLDPPPASACDPIDPAHCLLPFPNDAFTIPSADTDTGRLVQLDARATPRNTAGESTDTTEWNRNDGFSPGSMVMTYVPGLDLHQTWGTASLPVAERDQIADLSRFSVPDAPILLINTRTGVRHPFWSELDQAEPRPYEVDADKRMLIVRPAVNLTEGDRYLVVLRNLRDAAGQLISAPAPFAALRDGAPTTDPVLEARRPAIDSVLTEAEATEAAHGHAFDRSEVYLAWDFTVASERNLSERVLALRDDAFSRVLGDHDLADGIVDGDAPSYRIEKVTDFPVAESRHVARTIRGTLDVPNYLTGETLPVDVTVDARVPGAVSQPVADSGVEPAGRAGRTAADSSTPVAVPRTRLHDGDGDGLPDVNTTQPFLEVPFECHLPRSAIAADPALFTSYGHGLVGSKSQSRSSSTQAMAATANAAYCAVDWWGMAQGDLPNIVFVMHHLSHFPSFADRIQQGFLNQMWLSRAMLHPAGFGADPAFADAQGAPLVDNSQVFYDGNSQGGIMGAALVALSPDVRRANLGVPGINYSTLLNRSVDWEGLYAEPHYPNYRSKLEQQINFALMQMLWDRAEGNGYAAHLTTDPLPNTPTHEVMLQAAFADHQVTNVAAEVLARTAGVALKTPALTPVDGAQPAHWSVDPAFGLATRSFVGAGVDPATSLPVLPGAGSVLVYWYSGGNGNVTPPNGNVPSESGGDPHSHGRQDVNATRQKVRWLLTGDLLDVCGGAGCVTTPATRTLP